MLEVVGGLSLLLLIALGAQLSLERGGGGVHSCGVFVCTVVSSRIVLNRHRGRFMIWKLLRLGNLENSIPLTNFPKKTNYQDAKIVAS